MTSTTTGRPIFFPEKLVIFGNLALFVWIILDTVAFLLFDITDGIVFLVVTVVLIYGLLHLLGCLRPCYNCIKCTHGMGRLGSIILWQTHLQRLQIQLQTAHSNILHSVYRGVSSSIRALLCCHRFHSRQSSGFCGSFGAYNLQWLNVANNKTVNP